MNNSKWKNRLNAVLTGSAATGQKPEESLEKGLTITDKTHTNGVSSSFVSSDLALVPDFLENVFDYTSETGTEFINYLRGLDSPIILNSPNQRAYEIECVLYEGIRQRERGEISADYLEKIITTYISTHAEDVSRPEKWTGADVPLYYINIYLNGKIFEAYTCNIIQSHIIAAYWLGTHPEAHVSLISL